MFCSSCGSKVEDEQIRFCVKCGAPIVQPPKNAREENVQDIGKIQEPVDNSSLQNDGNYTKVLSDAQRREIQERFMNRKDEPVVAAKNRNTGTLVGAIIFSVILAINAGMAIWGPYVLDWYFYVLLVLNILTYWGYFKSGN